MGLLSMRDTKVKQGVVRLEGYVWDTRRRVDQLCGVVISCHTLKDILRRSLQYGFVQNVMMIVHFDTLIECNYLTATRKITSESFN